MIKSGCDPKCIQARHHRLVSQAIQSVFLRVMETAELFEISFFDLCTGSAVGRAFNQT